MGKTTWTVKGIIKVKENVTTDKYRVRPLGNVEVKVSGASVGRIFTSWGTTRTRDDGSFTFTKEKSSSKRDIKVEVCFKDNYLVITKPILNSDWYRIYDKKDKKSGIINIGTKTFEKSKSGDLGGVENYRIATAWYACKTVMSRLKSENSWFAFKKRIKIVYPAALLTKSSYANELTRSAYINPKKFDDGEDVKFLKNVIHEIMHLWNYDHDTGIILDNVIKSLCDGTTHSSQEKPNIAFLEGFAEYAKGDLLHVIWGREKIKLLNRRHLSTGNKRELMNLSDVEGSDVGVTNALHVLTTPKIYTKYFGTINGNDPPNNTVGTVSIKNAGCPQSPTIGLWDVLKVFRAAPNNGWKTDWDVGKKSYGMVRFFKRASDILPQFSKEHMDLCLELIDPSSNVEPQDYCKNWAKQKRILDSKEDIAIPTLTNVQSLQKISSTETKGFKRSVSVKNKKSTETKGFKRSL